MRTMFNVTGLLFFFIVSGCAYKIERTGVDNKKASVANTELGVAYLAQGKQKVAMNKLKKAIGFDNKNADAHHYIAILYGQLDEKELADEHFKLALDLNDEDSAIKNNYGIFLCGIGSYTEGLKSLNEALLDPLYSNKGKVYDNMGFCAEKKGNILKAEKFYEAALTFDKNITGSLLGLAQIEFDKNHTKKASSYLSRYNNLVKKNVTAQSLWLNILFARKNGDKNKLGSLVVRLKHSFPDSKEVLLLKKLNIR